MNGKNYRLTEKQQEERVIYLVESHNSMEWLTDGELYFSDFEVATDYYRIMHFGMMDELTPINPEEIVLYTSDPKTIITIETIEELLSCHNNDDDGYGHSQYDEDNAIYLEIIREGLGL